MLGVSYILKETFITGKKYIKSVSISIYIYTCLKKNDLIDKTCFITSLVSITH